MGGQRSGGDRRLEARLAFCGRLSCCLAPILSIKADFPLRPIYILPTSFPSSLGSLEFSSPPPTSSLTMSLVSYSPQAELADEITVRSFTVLKDPMLIVSRLL